MGKDHDEDPEWSWSQNINIILNVEKGFILDAKVIWCNHLYNLVRLWVISSKQNYTANPKNYLAILKLL